MPSFRISAWGENYLYVEVNPDAAYNWYRVYVRLDDGSNTKVYDAFHQLYATDYIRVGNLSPGTTYAVNVAYGTAASADYSVGWMGLQTVTTNGTSTTWYYAHFQFDANGGSGAPDFVSFMNTSQSVLVTLPSDAPTRSNYTFVGWSLSPDDTSGTIYPTGWTGYWPGTTDAMYINTLYAVWQKAGSGGGVQIGNGYGFDSYTPYIWNGSGWQKATPYVWNGAWRKGV